MSSSVHAEFGLIYPYVSLNAYAFLCCTNEKLSSFFESNLKNVMVVTGHACFSCPSLYYFYCICFLWKNI